MEDRGVVSIADRLRDEFMVRVKHMRTGGGHHTHTSQGVHGFRGGRAMPKGRMDKMTEADQKLYRRNYTDTGTRRKPSKGQRTPKVGKRGVGGNNTQAFGNDPNKRYEFKHRVVELENLITSNKPNGSINPDYDQRLQPRTRSRAASQAQIDDVARNLTPEALVWDFHQLDKGMPIVGEDLMVESGNGRTLALMRARDAFPDKWAMYQEEMRRNLGQYDIDPNDVKNMKNPVLVRERVTQVDRARFAQEANSPAVLQMSPLEQAAQDSRKIKAEWLNNFQVGEDQSIDQALRSAANRGFVRKFTGEMGVNERATIQRADGSLNRMGLWRIKAAIFSKVFPGEAGGRLADTFLESLDSNIKNFENSISRVMPKLAQAESLIKSGQRGSRLSIVDDLSKSLDMLARLKESRTPVRHYIRQGSLFARELTPIQERFLVKLDGMSKSPKRIREWLGQYADAVINAPDPRQGGMFADVGLTREQLVERLLGE